MANNSWNLVMDDNYINEVKSYVISASTDANDKLEVLIETLNRASAEGCTDGKTAEMLKLNRNPDIWGKRKWDNCKM